MDNLVIVKNNDIFTDSLVIANGTDNQHHAIQQLMIKYNDKMERLGKVTFQMRPLESGQKQKVYDLNETQATFLITLLKNSDKVVDFKLELVKEFYRMRQALMERQTTAWIETRQHGKLTRKSETDIIKELVEYAQSQGSKNADKLYTVYSKLANTIAGTETRDNATISQLNNLSLIENIILHEIRSGMILNKHYKEIYQDCKLRLKQFTQIAYLSA